VRSTRASVGRCHSPMSRGTGNSVDFGSNPVTWPVRQHCSCSGPSCSARGRPDTTCRTVPLSGFVGAVGVTDEDLKAFLDMVSRRLPSPAGNREICLEPATKRWIDGSLRA
jgi:ABC-type molybdenum transport system ATPase subunit/photorepair protein PhrA